MLKFIFVTLSSMLTEKMLDIERNAESIVILQLLMVIKLAARGVISFLIHQAREDHWMSWWTGCIIIRKKLLEDKQINQSCRF